MLGLALIAALILWIIVIALSVWLPQKIFKDSPRVAGIASIIGFMLTCGFWTTKWSIESHMAQKEAREMCKKVGVTIYVQPEKWKEMVGGEEAWKKLGYTQENFTSEEKKIVPKEIYFENNKYRLFSKENDRVGLYGYSLRYPYGLFSSYIYYDFLTKTVLYKDDNFQPAGVSLDAGFKILFFRKGGNCTNKVNVGYDTFKKFFYILK